MTKTYEKKSTIALFKNTRKATLSDKYKPSDYNAKITLVEDLKAGEYEAGVYVRQSKAGNEYLQGNIRPAKPRGEAPQAKVELDDEIPF